MCGQILLNQFTLDDVCIHNSNDNNDTNATVRLTSIRINSVLYEPLDIPQGSFGEDFTIFTSSDDYTCATIDFLEDCFFDYSDLWYTFGIDMMDSNDWDGHYTYVNQSVDNGVDIYIVDSVIPCTHADFYENQVMHVMGNGAAHVEDINDNDEVKFLCVIACAVNVSLFFLPFLPCFLLVFFALFCCTFSSFFWFYPCTFSSFFFIGCAQYYISSNVGKNEDEKRKDIILEKNTD